MSHQQHRVNSGWTKTLLHPPTPLAWAHDRVDFKKGAGVHYPPGCDQGRGWWRRTRPGSWQGGSRSGCRWSSRPSPCPPPGRLGSWPTWWSPPPEGQCTPPRCWTPGPASCPHRQTTGQSSNKFPARYQLDTRSWPGPASWTDNRKRSATRKLPC